MCLRLISVSLGMSDVQKYQQLIVPVLKRNMINAAAIFGSVAKGHAQTSSDIDILIDPSENFTLFNFLQLEEELSSLLNRKVDLVEYSALKPSIKKEVLESAITIL